MTSEVLKPCPFCGGEASKRLFYGARYGVYCDECDARVGGLFNTEPEAIAAWNTRAERTCRCETSDDAWCFSCSACGKSFPRSKLHLAHNHGEINYCPNCGAKVKAVSDDER